MHFKLHAGFYVLGIASINECLGAGHWRAQGYLAQRGEAFFLHNGEKKAMFFEFTRRSYLGSRLTAGTR